VLDGHGGPWCARLVRELFEAEIRKNLLDPIEGIYGSQRKGVNECIDRALRKTFYNIDDEYYRQR